VLATLLWMTRKTPPHPSTVGVVCSSRLLARAPLSHHTYLYYLYLPLGGMCWTCAGAESGGAPMARTQGTTTRAAGPAVAPTSGT